MLIYGGSFQRLQLKDFSQCHLEMPGIEHSTSLLSLLLLYKIYHIARKPQNSSISFDSCMEAYQKKVGESTSIYHIRIFIRKQGIALLKVKQRYFYFCFVTIVNIECYLSSHCGVAQVYVHALGCIHPCDVHISKTNVFF